MTLRNTPSQNRAQARVEEIRAAALQHYEEVGRDSFTTGGVAKIMGCSIGTIYRYFENRVVLLDFIKPDRDTAADKLVQIKTILDNYTTQDQAVWDIRKVL